VNRKGKKIHAPKILSERLHRLLARVKRQ